MLQGQVLPIGAAERIRARTGLPSLSAAHPDADLETIGPLRDRAMRNLLVAIIRQAILDLQEGEQYRKSGEECTCDWHQRRHAITAHRCPYSRPYLLLSAQRWIRDCSREVGGFGWACAMLGWPAEIIRDRVLNGAVKIDFGPRRELFA